MIEEDSKGGEASKEVSEVKEARDIEVEEKPETTCADRS
jgi:hypothetical protein